MTYGEGQVPEPLPPHPDWEALAEANAAEHRRRKRLLWGGGAAGATAVAAVVAVLLATGGAEDPGPKDGTDDRSAAADAMPSFGDPSPMSDPLVYLSDARKDTAPLRGGLLFGTRAAEVADRTYALSDGDTTKDCTRNTDATLGKVLAAHHCTLFMRANYTRSDVQVTVGVAVFDTAAEAAAAKADAHGGVKALPASKSKPFCAPKVVCRRTANAYGRYLYVTLTGFTGNKNATKKDEQVHRAGNDLAERTFQRILRRGYAAAEADGHQG
ncbi:hypothetical protein [Streptomyces sp. NRRL S-87]|uniref:hypothetical protein n=1 Tax=Streptomyces sp. NRRL S-87 TaxID=1463920 RepID=UPI0004C0544E|nr:hypothetical protein [Streptomyces sp. NRRL S-87]